MKRIEYTRVLTRPNVLAEALNAMGAEGWDVFHVQDDAMYKGQRMFMLLGKRQSAQDVSDAITYPEGTVVEAIDWSVAPQSPQDYNRQFQRLLPDANACQCPAPCVVHTQ